MKDLLHCLEVSKFHYICEAGLGKMIFYMLDRGRSLMSVIMHRETVSGSVRLQSGVV